MKGRRNWRMECRKRKTFSYRSSVNVGGPEVVDTIALLSWSCSATRIRGDNGSAITVVDTLDALLLDLLSIFCVEESNRRGRRCPSLTEQPNLFSPLVRAVRGLLLVRCLISDTEANTFQRLIAFRRCPLSTHSKLPCRGSRAW